MDRKLERWAKALDRWSDAHPVFGGFCALLLGPVLAPLLLTLGALGMLVFGVLFVARWLAAW